MMTAADYNLSDMADTCDDKAIELAAQYFADFDEGRRANPELIDLADKMLRLGQGFRDLGRKRYGAESE